jgi:anthranilate synthase component 2
MPYSSPTKYTRKMKLTVIDNYDSFVYNIVRYLRELSYEVCVMRNDTIDRNELNKSDGIILSPGPGIPEEAGDLLKVIEEYHLSKPEIVHGRSSTLNMLYPDTLFKGLNDPIEVGRYHSWILDADLPEILIPTSTGPKGELMSFKHQTLPISGVQFHPESILTPYGRKMINNWLDAIVQRSNANLNKASNERIIQ